MIDVHLHAQLLIICSNITTKNDNVPLSQFTLSLNKPGIEFFFLVLQELPGGYGRVKPDVVTYGSGVRGSSLKYVLFC